MSSGVLSLHHGTAFCSPGRPSGSGGRMRILRVLPIVLGGMTTAGLMTAPASAENVYSFNGSTEYKDSISVNSYRTKRSNLGAMDVRPSERAERRERRSSRTARVA